MSSGRWLTRKRRTWLFLVLIVLTLYVLIPQLAVFHSSWSLLRHPRMSWVILSLATTGMTYLVGAITLSFLALKPLDYPRTVLVQLAAMFLNRLLPAGIGALGANLAYLRRQGHSVIQATAVVTANNAIGLVGHGILLLGALLLFPNAINDLHHPTAAMVLRALAGLAILLLLVLLIWGRRRISRLLRGLRRQLVAYGQRPYSLAAALFSSMLLTMFNVLSLYYCVRALGIQLPVAIVFIIFSFGISAATAVPTPGGVGGFEAGLTAGFVAYHVPGPTALAIALLYRLVSYWLPLLPGGLALLISQRLKLLVRN